MPIDGEKDSAPTPTPSAEGVPPSEVSQDEVGQIALYLAERNAPDVDKEVKEELAVTYMVQFGNLISTLVSGTKKVALAAPKRVATL